MKAVADRNLLLPNGYSIAQPGERVELKMPGTVAEEREDLPQKGAGPWHPPVDPWACEICGRANSAWFTNRSRRRLSPRSVVNLLLLSGQPPRPGLADQNIAQDRNDQAILRPAGRLFAGENARKRKHPQPQTGYSNLQRSTVQL